MVTDLRLIGIGDAEQHADRPHWQLRAEIEHEVEPVRARRSGSRHAAQNARTFSSSAFIRFGVKARETSAR